jgi:UDP-N-acetylmuramoylalanine--D-glutamate ligase
VPFTTATNLYLARARAAGLAVVGVTGSKGKSTTASLIHRGLVAAGRDAALVGNIGHAALDALDGVLARGATTVFELSSYQCSTLTLGPSVAVLTNLFPEHLDWHGDLATYYADKLLIAATQRRDDLTVWNGANAELRARRPLGPAAHVAFNAPGAWCFDAGTFFDGDVPRFTDAGMRLRGRHNRENACAVFTVLARLGVDVDDGPVRDAVLGFTGLPHRLEPLGEAAGVRWVNDSISTAPEAAVAALEAFAGEAATLIAGGFDRGYDFTPLANAVRAQGITAVAVLPPSGLRLAELLRDAPSVSVHVAADLDDAVRWIAPRTPAGRTCVFSPASPSYGRYRDFIARGEHLRALVAALAPRT